MSADDDDGDLRVLRGTRTTDTTYAALKASEKKARTIADGRKDRPSQAVVHLNVALSPDLKKRLVRVCKSHDMKIVDFVREALEAALDKLEAK